MRAAHGSRRASPPGPRRGPRRCSPRGGRAAARVAGPTPHSRSTVSGCRNSSSWPGSTTRRPSGLARSLASLASCLVAATPTDAVRPVSARTRRRISAPISGAGAVEAADAADVEERLVERDRLHERCERAQDRHDVAARGRVRVEARREEHGVRAGARGRAPSASRNGSRTGAPRSSRPRRRRGARGHRRRPDGRAASGPRAARPTRRTRRDRRAGRREHRPCAVGTQPDARRTWMESRLVPCTS